MSKTKKGLTLILLAVLLLLVVVVCNRNSSKRIWIGEYSYSEFIEPNIGRDYKVHIIEQGNDLIADVQVDGYQTLIRWQAAIVGDKNKISLRYVENYDDDRGSSLNSGDIIVTFMRKNGELYTKWGELKPFLQQSPGKWEEAFK